MLPSLDYRLPTAIWTDVMPEERRSDATVYTLLFKQTAAVVVERVVDCNGFVLRECQCWRLGY
jgi:hypothetical protein